MQFVRNLLLGFLHFLDKGFGLSRTFVISALDLALRCFDPADRDGKINGHEHMLVVVHEGYSIAKILLEANLMVLCVLVERSLVFADCGLMLKAVLIKHGPLEGEFEVAGGNEQS